MVIVERKRENVRTDGERRRANKQYMSPKITKKTSLDAKAHTSTHTSMRKRHVLNVHF
jgi:hypothetical protein